MPEHSLALNDWPADGTTLYTSGQILREYVAVATRPAVKSGLGLGQADALQNVRVLRARMRFVEENEKVNQRLTTLLDDIVCTGNQIHDANVVATMLVHGMETVVTVNIEDFARYEGYVRGLSP